MLALVAPMLIAAGIGIVTARGAVDQSRVSIRGWPVLVAALALELALYNPPLDRLGWARQDGPWLWIGCRLVMQWVVLLNVRRSGQISWAWVLAACGLGLNTLVIALNQGHMPQSVGAAQAVWGTSNVATDRLDNTAVMGLDTRLAWLGDVLPEPRWLPRANVVSPGDLLLAAGAAWWMARATWATSPRRGVVRGSV